MPHRRQVEPKAEADERRCARDALPLAAMPHASSVISTATRRHPRAAGAIGGLML